MYNFYEKINDWYADLMDNGTRIKCPNCEERTILQYPTTTCGHCDTVFSNNIHPKPTIQHHYDGGGFVSFATSLMVLSMILSKH
jgi:hypothetical protein